MFKSEFIPDEDSLYRRIHPDHYDKEHDVVSSAAFRGDCYTSVDWDKYTTPQKSVRGYPNHHLAALQAKIPRMKGQEVRHTPSRNRAHSSIIGNKTYSVAKFLAGNSTIIVRPS